MVSRPLNYAIINPLQRRRSSSTSDALPTHRQQLSVQSPDGTPVVHCRLLRVRHNLRSTRLQHGRLLPTVSAHPGHLCRRRTRAMFGGVYRQSRRSPSRVVRVEMTNPPTPHSTGKKSDLSSSSLLLLLWSNFIVKILFKINQFFDKKRNIFTISSL